MGIGILPIGKTVRLAIVVKVDFNYVECEFYDRFGEKPIRCPVPHPYAGRGGGVLVGIEKDTLVLVANGPQEQWFIVAIIPDVNFSFDVEGAQDIRVGETSYPKLSEGEVILKGNPGQTIELRKNGNIAMDAGIGDKSYDLELSRFCQGMFVRVNNVYRFTEAGRSVEGLVKRDLHEKEESKDTSTTDFLSGESYDRMLTEIGRSPTDEVQNRTTTILKAVTRNPALVEKRQVVYEFGESFNVRGFDYEQKAMTPITGDIDGGIKETIQALRSDPTTRENRRTDVLDLNQRNYNHLIETVEGTLVDIYGNVLDINRNKINIPEVGTVVDQGNGNNNGEGLKRLYDHLRRSVKYHFEINTRKDLKSEPRAPEEGIPADNLKDHSRFSVDIDAEGLTKINIPATSETGNIPVLGRYTVNRDAEGEKTDNGDFKEENRTDLNLNQFGAPKNGGGGFAGQLIKDSSYLPKTTNNLPITVGSAFHDLFNIANSIFTNGKLKRADPNDASSPTVPPLTSEINNKIAELGDTSNEPNAGGRSVHLNLDGSVEASIGADTVDRKSIVIDTAGGLLAHFGRDKNGRSIIGQTDGDVILQVGGTSINDERFPFDSNVPRPGRLEIHFNNPGQDPSKIIIDEKGITISSQGRMVLHSVGQMSLSSEASVLINGENIKQFGSFDPETREIVGSESRVPRKGRIGS